jgi:hypothetical protein
MAELFSGNIDFHRSLRKDDRFSWSTKPWKPTASRCAAAAC